MQYAMLKANVKVNRAYLRVVYGGYNNAVIKAVTRIYFRGVLGTTQHSLYGRSPKGRGGVGFLGRTRRAPSPPARGLRERCKLPQWGPGQSPGRNRFWCISKLVEGIKNSLYYKTRHRWFDSTRIYGASLIQCNIAAISLTAVLLMTHEQWTADAFLYVCLIFP